MYSWGEDARVPDRSTAGYDYKSARDAYKESAAPLIDRTSTGAGSSRSKSYKSKIGKTLPPIGKELVTESTHPIVIATDVTGSMSSWPSIIFEKLPLLGKEVERYAPNYAISFTAFGDCYADSHPLQVRDFDVGDKLDEHVNCLYPEGGGGDDPESHDLAAYYYVHHCKIEKAVKPIFFMITDTYSHDCLRSDAIKRYTGDDTQGKSIDSMDIFKKLSEKFNVYVILKGDRAKDFWSKIFGEQKVISIEEPRDIVEIIIGMIASEVGELKDFEMRSSKRHADKPDRVERVMKSVKIDGASVSIDDVEGGKAKSSKSHKSESMKSKKLV